jgi:hypothetical protein
MSDDLQQVLAGLPEADAETMAEAEPGAFRAAVLFTAGTPRHDRRTGRVFGRWQDSVSRACEGGPVTALENAAIDILRRMEERCGNRDELWECIRK